MLANDTVITWPDEKLRQVSEPVARFDEGLVKFIASMERVMRKGPAAVGIAAPQVGCLVRVIIVDTSARKGRSHGRLIMVNPEIISWEGSVSGREGCLSVPDFVGNVMRAKEVVVEFQDALGELHNVDFSHFEARVVQHEIDHLNGLLFLDRVVSRRSDLMRR